MSVSLTTVTLLLNIKQIMEWSQTPDFDPSEIDLTLFLCRLEQISAKQQQLVCEIYRRGTACEVLARWDCAAFGAAALQL